MHRVHDLQALRAFGMILPGILHIISSTPRWEDDRTRRMIRTRRDYANHEDDKNEEDDKNPADDENHEDDESQEDDKNQQDSRNLSARHRRCSSKCPRMEACLPIVSVYPRTA